MMRAGPPGSGAHKPNSSRVGGEQVIPEIQCLRTAIWYK